jgi:hypothetical protein
MTEQELDIVLLQLKSGKTISESFPGENRYYFFDTNSEQFYCRKLDSVINSYNLLFRISKSELRYNLQTLSKETLLSQGITLSDAIIA